MSHARINGRNISRHWLKRHPEVAVERMVLKLCVLILLSDYLEIQAALDELVRDGAVRELPAGRYIAV